MSETVDAGVSDVFDFVLSYTLDIGAMTTDQAIKWFGGVARLAKALGCARQTPYTWGQYPPNERQHQIEHVTGGELKAEPTWLRSDSAA